MTIIQRKFSKMEIVNIDYIGTISVKDAKVEIIKQEIPKNKVLLNDLDVLRKEPKETSIAELQSRMNEEFPQFADGIVEIGFVEPFHYGDSYVGYARYPNAKQYVKEIENRIAEYIKQASEKYEDLHNSPEEFQKKVSDYVASHKKDLIPQETNAFYCDCIRFIHAYSYNSLRIKLLSRPEVKMLTSANIGFDSRTYKITDDVSITVYSNFGFGQSAFFYVTLNYKGINIVPFSMLVTYFFANQLEIRQFFRKYPTCRESWDHVLMDVQDTVSMTLDNPEEFVKNFIVKDISKMLEGLRKICNAPEEYMLKFCEKQGEDSHYLTVRNMAIYEYKRYAVYPKEMTMVMQASKISGALDFLDNLASLTPIYEKAQDAIQEIKEMALHLLPKLESDIESVSGDIECLETRLKMLESYSETLDLRIESHVKALDELRNKKESEPGLDDSQIVSEYNSALQERARIEADKLRIKGDIHARNDFLTGLNSCRERIRKESLLS